MGDILDIDAPGEVIGASGRVHYAAADGRDRVTGAVAAMTGGGGGESALDDYLVGRVQWIASSLSRVVAEHADRSALLHEYTAQAANDLANADLDGGGLVGG